MSKKAGPFDMVICTGVFFNDEPEGEGIESSDIILWSNLKSGKVNLTEYVSFKTGVIHSNT